jgi:energy-coupling factor transporter ATP-binding protein EcfA2
MVLYGKCTKNLSRIGLKVRDEAMTGIIEKIVARAWNGVAGRKRRKQAYQESSRVDFGLMIKDGAVSKFSYGLSQGTRAEHIAILGKTGSGKSYFLRHLASQDIRSDHGFVYFDLHGDATAFLLSALAAREERDGVSLTEKVIVINPADPEYSVGLNVLEAASSREGFVQIAEFAQILKTRWHLDSFGARTEELLRNALYVLRDNELTLLELSLLLTNGTFRASCVRQVQNYEVGSYFNSRYDQASEAMQAVMRDAVLNKISVFTADPHFRHIVGQKHSTISLEEAIDRGCYVIVNLHKGKLGEQAATLGSLILSRLKNALFSRKSRKTFAVYADEVQNLVAYDSGLDTLLSESRKFAISVVTANQFLDQYPAAMRSAILSVGTHVCFQLSSQDADKMAANLAGSKTLADTLKNLPHQELIVKSGSRPAAHVQVPTVEIPRTDYRDLYNRSRNRWARQRPAIEQEIRERQRDATASESEVLDAWE